MRFEILTIFPDFFRGPLEYGILRRAREAGLVEVGVRDLRQFTSDRHRTVDDRPFGGGEGMVLKPEPIFAGVESLNVTPHAERRLRPARESVVLLSAQGEMFRQSVAEELAAMERVILICGRYEGVDERVSEFLADRELSIGDFVLSGGELAAALVVDAVTRLLPGALGNEASVRQESFTAPCSIASTVSRRELQPDSTCGAGGLLDYPHYTRPADFRGMRVPEVLVSGKHDDIRRWRRRKALEKTTRNRPDLLDRAPLSGEDRALVTQLLEERS